MKYIFTLILTFTLGYCYAQQTPAKKQSTTISIQGGTIHIGNGNTIKNGLLVFENGKISFVGSNKNATNTKGKIIDATGKHIYPGFIAPNSTLGLVEIDAVRATRDQTEIGAMNPHIRSIIAYNTESKVVESMRPNGVLMAQITPRGGRISGTSSIVQLDAWNWEDAILKQDDGIHLNWPNVYSRGRWWLGEPNTIKANKKYDEEVQNLYSYFKNSKAYNTSNNTTPNLPFIALNGIFNGNKTLFIHTDNEKSIIDAITFSKQFSIAKKVIVGGYYAGQTANLLKENNIPVLIQRVHTRPNNNDDDYDQPYKLATELVNKGILVGLQNTGDMERMQTRNLPFLAGTTVAHGLTKAQALQLITLNTAKILGIDRFCGSLEVNKDATLFISEGDALDMRTNKLTHAFIQGRELSLETHQTELYKRYSNKYK